MKLHRLHKKSLPPLPLDMDRMMKAVPLHNEAVTVETRNGRVTLWAPVQPRWWMRPPFSWVLNYRRRRGVELDALGASVWEACDGKRSVEDLVSDFARRHRLPFHEARIAVSRFLRSLMKRHLVVLAVKR